MYAYDDDDFEPSFMDDCLTGLCIFLFFAWLILTKMHQ